MNNTRNKVAVITGGNSGIGLALAQNLLNEDFCVLITSRSGEVTLSHPKLSVVKLDLKDEASIANSKIIIENLVSKVDLLINNAGIADDIHLLRPTLDSFKDTIAINLTGTIFFTEALLPLLSEEAVVVNISSEMGLLAHLQPNAYAYRISKAGINVYTKLLAQSYEGTGIKVLAIHPGWVRTKLGGDLAPVLPNEAARGIIAAIKQEKDTGTYINVYSGQSVHI
jgi:NAD(P)-dependent dehydrogenase (short-subunit alcohol dehydrogenase family)